ncbi:MAG: SAM-dependent methyltransferase [Thermoplasmata archaeon]|nr:SAM-dependent methyltransferase [Thermoplasmata archaeon]MCI4354876.1 SAM-dependent methyltransferase [Thermoplasmata archaeon]
MDGETLGLVLFVVLVLIAYFVFASFLFGAGYQPAPRASVTAMLDFAQIGPEDTVYDLGAGTGAVVFRAARERGARTVGIEVEPLRIGILRLRRRLGGAADRIELRWGNIFDQDIRPATVVATFLWPDAMVRLRPIFEAQLRPGTRVVSHWHAIPGWTPERYDPAVRVYLYRVPTTGPRGVAT